MIHADVRYGCFTTFQNSSSQRRLIGVKLSAAPRYSVIPAKAGTHGCGEKHAYILPQIWFPAFAGMTNFFKEDMI